METVHGSVGAVDCLLLTTNWNTDYFILKIAGIFELYFLSVQSSGTIVPKYSVQTLLL